MEVESSSVREIWRAPLKPCASALHQGPEISPGPRVYESRSREHAAPATGVGSTCSPTAVRLRELT